MKGDRNAYRCHDCGGAMYTIDVDDGVTPMFLRCRLAPRQNHPCGGRAVSLMYPKPTPENWPEPRFEWYRARDNSEHTKLGGLTLRERKT